MELQAIWFFLWGLLWAVYFITDGYDLGAGLLMPFLAKDDAEKRMILNAGGPFWDGNEVWLIAAGGVTFAAFPPVYAAMFSGLYTALMLLLFALIVRGVSFEFRGKLDSPGWRKVWDVCHVAGSFLPALLLGVAFANLFQGIPLDQNGYFQGTILTLLNPYGLAGGVLFVVMFALHGAIWLTLRTTGDLRIRAVRTASALWPAFTLLVVVFLVWSALATNLLANFLAMPALIGVLLVPAAGLVLTRLFLGQGKLWLAFAASCASIVGVAFFGLIGLFPNMLASTLNPEWSLTAYNASSSPLTLKIMLGVALVFVPIVLVYQIWVYKTFAHPLTASDLDYEESY